MFPEGNIGNESLPAYARRSLAMAARRRGDEGIVPYGGKTVVFPSRGGICP